MISRQNDRSKGRTESFYATKMPTESIANFSSTPYHIGRRSRIFREDTGFAANCIAPSSASFLFTLWTMLLWNWNPAKRSKYALIRACNARPSSQSTVRYPIF